ncbi:MAG: hypothetical protein J6040_02710 [Clostridiales bacterium]|nr:hypothetical protein [Clostridiales bacterium]
MEWNTERVREILQSRYKGKDVREIWRGSESPVALVIFKDGSEQTVIGIDRYMSDERVANLIERAI